jgi:hypothetical protein
VVRLLTRSWNELNAGDWTNAHGNDAGVEDRYRAVQAFKVEIVRAASLSRQA